MKDYTLDYSVIIASHEKVLKKNCHIAIFCCKYLSNNKINIWQLFDNCHKMPYIAIFV